MPLAAGNGVAQQDFKLPVRDRLDIAGVVVGQRFAVVGVFRPGPGHGHVAGQLDIRRGGADQDLILAALDLKLVGFDIEVPERFVVKGDGDGFALTGLQEDLLKTFQLLTGSSGQTRR